MVQVSGAQRLSFIHIGHQSDDWHDQFLREGVQDKIDLFEWNGFEGAAILGLPWGTHC